MISLFGPSHAALVTRCHRRTTLVDATEALRDTLNATGAFTAGPARLLDTSDDSTTAFTLIHKGARYRVTIQGGEPE